MSAGSATPLVLPKASPAASVSFGSIFKGLLAEANALDPNIIEDLETAVTGTTPLPFPFEAFEPYRKDLALGFQLVSLVEKYVPLLQAAKAAA